MNTFYCLLSSFVLFAFIIYCMKHVCAKNCNEAPRDEKEEPIYCRWRDGKWDGEYRNKEGEIITMAQKKKVTEKEKIKTRLEETKKEFKQPFYCHWINGKWDRKFRDAEGNIVE